MIYGGKFKILCYTKINPPSQNFMFLFLMKDRFILISYSTGTHHIRESSIVSVLNTMHRSENIVVVPIVAYDLSYHSTGGNRISYCVINHNQFSPRELSKGGRHRRHRILIHPSYGAAPSNCFGPRDVNRTRHIWRTLRICAKQHGCFLCHIVRNVHVCIITTAGAVRSFRRR